MFTANGHAELGKQILFVENIVIQTCASYKI